MNAQLRQLLIRVAEAARAHAAACKAGIAARYMETAHQSNAAERDLRDYVAANEDARAVGEVNVLALALWRAQEASEMVSLAWSSIEALGERLASEGSATTEPASAPETKEVA